MAGIHFLKTKYKQWTNLENQNQSLMTRVTQVCTWESEFQHEEPVWLETSCVWVSCSLSMIPGPQPNTKLDQNEMTWDLNPPFWQINVFTQFSYTVNEIESVT